PDTLPIAPPTFSGSIAVAFDPANSRIAISWPTATDADEPLASPQYETNISTSGSLDPGAWTAATGTQSIVEDVSFPNNYALGVRAVNDFGNLSAPILTTWSFPSGYAPAPSQLSHSQLVADSNVSEEITFLATTTAAGVDFWIEPQGGQYCCS